MAALGSYILFYFIYSLIIAKFPDKTIVDWYGSEIMVNNMLLPKEFTLSPVYTNSFNPTTTLSLALPAISNVLLEVYYINGRLINELIKSNMDAGYHSVIWNADNNASGVYFVKMVTPEFTKTQKLMLVK